MINSHPQRGAALLYVMLIFVASSMIAVAMVQSERLDILRTERFIAIQQARQYALGTEIYARQLLYADMNDKTEADYATETWASAKPDFSIESGDVAMRIEDLRGRFNINSVLTGNPAAQKRFIALCTVLGIDTSQAKTLLTNLTPDHPPTDNISDVGAPLAPFAAGAAFADPSELIDAGLAIQQYQQLEPYLSALPNASMAININTASEAILHAVLPDESQVTSVRNAIAHDGYITKDQLGAVHISDPTLTVTSEFFRVHITVHLRGQLVHLSSTLQCRDKEIVTIARSWTE